MSTNHHSSSSWEVQQLVNVWIQGWKHSRARNPVFFSGNVPGSPVEGVPVSAGSGLDSIWESCRQKVYTDCSESSICISMNLPWSSKAEKLKESEHFWKIRLATGALWKMRSAKIIRMNSFIRSFVRSFVQLFPSWSPSFKHSLIYSFLHSFLPSFLHSFLHSFFPSFRHSFIPSFTPSFLHSFIHSCIPLFIPSFIHSCIHSLQFISFHHVFLSLQVFISSLSGPKTIPITKPLPLVMSSSSKLPPRARHWDMSSPSAPTSQLPPGSLGGIFAPVRKRDLIHPLKLWTSITSSSPTSPTSPRSCAWSGLKKVMEAASSTRLQWVIGPT